MVSSASITMADRQLGQPFYYVTRQLVHLGLGLVLALLVLQVKLSVWERGSFVWLALAWRCWPWCWCRVSVAK
jgi:cell division protein FtsW